MVVPKPDTGLEQRVETIRRFNRMYMQKIGILEEQIFGSAFSPAELRVLHEIGFQKETTASTLARDLKMDNGYLSRILQGFEQKGLITKERSKEDARQYKIVFTAKGQQMNDEAMSEAQKIMVNIVSPLPVEEQIRLVAAMSTIDYIVNEAGHFDAKRVRAPFTLREHRLGDIGRIIHACAVQFAADYGWSHEFEAELADRAAKFIRNYHPSRERCFVVEIDGHLVGSVFLMKQSDEVCEALLPYVSPEARGMGIGSHLMKELVGFAKNAGYRRLLLRTESVLDFAVSMFQAAGMKLVKETPHRRFGRDSIGQDWELAL